MRVPADETGGTKSQIITKSFVDIQFWQKVLNLMEGCYFVESVYH